MLQVLACFTKVNFSCVFTFSITFFVPLFRLQRSFFKFRLSGYYCQHTFRLAFSYKPHNRHATHLRPLWVGPPLFSLAIRISITATFNLKRRLSKILFMWKLCKHQVPSSNPLSHHSSSRLPTQQSSITIVHHVSWFTNLNTLINFGILWIAFNGKPSCMWDFSNPLEILRIQCRITWESLKTCVLKTYLIGWRSH